MKKTSSFSVFFKGILLENPVFVLILGTCPTLAMTGSVTSAFGMGLAAAAVLICSNVVISLLRRIIPETVRIPCYIVVIASFVTLVDMVMHAYLPELHKTLGVYLALITVNCIILGRAEMFASKNTVGKAALDGAGMGIGFTLALVSMATVREVLGAGTFAGIAIPFMADYTIKFFIEAPGGLMVYGLMIALVNVITHGKLLKKKEFSCAGCHMAGACGSCPASGEKEATV